MHETTSAPHVSRWVRVFPGLVLLLSLLLCLPGVASAHTQAARARVTPHFSHNVAGIIIQNYSMSTVTGTFTVPCFRVNSANTFAGSILNVYLQAGNSSQYYQVGVQMHVPNGYYAFVGTESNGHYSYRIISAIRIKCGDSILVGLINEYQRPSISMTSVVIADMSNQQQSFTDHPPISLSTAQWLTARGSCYGHYSYLPDFGKITWTYVYANPSANPLATYDLVSQPYTDLTMVRIGGVALATMSSPASYKSGTYTFATLWQAYGSDGTLC